MRISVLGAGSWGTTLALLLYTNHHDVTLWTYKEKHAELIREIRLNPSFLPDVPIPADLPVTSDLQAAIKNTEMIVVAIPTQFIRPVFVKLKDDNLNGVYIVNVAKGIENDTLMTVSEIIKDICPSVSLSRQAILSGPSHAEEVSKNIPTAVVAASKDMNTAQIVQHTFLSPHFRVYVNNDLRGVELGGALKNVIAIAAGISDGLGFGDNTKAAIMTRGIVEISRLGIAMGADAASFSGLSGIGDLIVTCMSKHSRNRFVGEQIGRGRTLNDILAEMVMIAEGVATTKSVHELSKKYSVEMPMSNEVYNMLFEGKDPYQATEDLMTRDATIEH